MTDVNEPPGYGFGCCINQSNTSLPQSGNNSDGTCWPPWMVHSSAAPTVQA